ncbi:MAG: elongation factor G [Ruminococcaceae bacterium]|nr:elongation factor G [Oscillospiraceae bacterium]
MKLYNAQDIRNIALVGHGSSGKTTLAESMLYIAKATDRLGKVTDGNTVMDCDAEEKKRKVSVATAVAPFEYEGKKVNLIDAPGLFDFECGMYEAIRAAKTTLIVLSANSGVSVGSEKAFKAASKRGTSRAFAVTKCERENTNFYKVLDGLKEKYGTKICPAVVPVYDGDGKVECYANLITHKAVKYGADNKPVAIDFPEFEQYDELMEVLKEAVASADDELMEKFFEGEEFTTEEIRKGLKQAMLDDVAYPVYACDGLTTRAVDMLMTSIVNFFPAASTAVETATDKDGNEVELKCDENGPLAAVVFKTIADPFVGKLSFFKVVSGKITPEVPGYNSRTGESERLGKIVVMRGAKQEDSKCIPAGDIGAVTKLDSFVTGDTLSAPDKGFVLAGVDVPGPLISRAIKVVKKGDEAKASGAIQRICEEDPALHFEQNHETHEMVISGLGEQHLDVAVSKMKTKFGVEVTLAIPKVAYRETITKMVQVQGKHKKQSGGSGQYGDVWVEFQPFDGEFEFDERVVGGSVPKQYFPAVEKGLAEAMKKGVLAGYPMVGVKATLYDGSYHSVDSNEMAFKTAASLAYKNGIPQAAPVILEPISEVKAYVNDDVMGEIIGDFNKRRGRVLGMNPVDDMQEITAEVPTAEMGDFATVLRQVTQGRGWYTMEFVRYERAIPAVAEKVIEAAKAEE